MGQKIKIKSDEIELTDEIETFYEAEIKPHGNSGRANVPKEHIGKRAYVIILKE